MDQRGPGEGAEGRVSSHKKDKRIQDPGKMQELQQLEGAGGQDSSSFKESHAGTATGRVGEGGGGPGVLGG